MVLGRNSGGYSSPIIYSSASKAIVPPTDPGYVAFTATGITPQFWPRDATGAVTTAALDAVLVAAGMPPTGLTAPTNAQLNSYANAKVVSLLSGEKTYPISGVGSIVCAELPAAADLLSINAWGLANPSATQQWTDDAYNVFTLTGAQAVTLSNTALAYGQSVYAVLATAAIQIASGAITTEAQIDALTWPT